MCGIAGYIALDSTAPVPVLQAMTDCIAHRGPDGSGVQQTGNVAIGHRRLSIIDLASGAQPMSNANKTIWITYNGELYNYKEIRSELEKKGISFATSSDTEVIIYAYQVWGSDCLQRFRGMFAFGIVDTEKRQLLLARDHFGIKPLYIYSDERSFAFASELQQFKSLPSFDRTLDLEALDNYLWLQYIPAPRTVFAKAKKLKPAHYMTVSFDGVASEQKEYWNVSFSHKQTRTKSEWIEATGEKIRESIKAHLVSDVPFGAFLSGGIDSTLVVKYMSGALQRPVKTFSIGFEEQEYNELHYSELAAKKYGTEHFTQVVKPDALGLLPKLVKHYGEPFGDSSAIPTYYVCELARKHVTMVLSGDGGDEAFAGYGTYTDWMKMLPVNYRTGFKKQLYPYLEKLLPSRYPKKDTLSNWLGLIEYLDKDWRTRLWKKEVMSGLPAFPEGFSAHFAKAEKFSPANKVQYMDLKTYMPFDILTKVDVASMCHSLEVRTPLIDKEVWEYAASIPEEFNINNKSGKWEGKQLLKELLREDFPADFIFRKKQGFAIPLNKWFAREGELRQKLNDSVLAPGSRLSAYLDPKAVGELLQSQNTGGMWLLLFLEEWLRQFETR